MIRVKKLNFLHLIKKRLFCFKYETLYLINSDYFLVITIKVFLQPIQSALVFLSRDYPAFLLIVPLTLPLILN
jgi:hypothetical protein